MIKKYNSRHFVAILLMVCFGMGCARGPRVPEGPHVDEGLPAGAEAREAEMGRQIHQAILSSFRIYSEPRLVGYVTRTGRSLARRAERQNLKYRFTVLYDDRAYATEAPGGFVYITTGFLNYLQNESELAALLAFEIATLQFRDPKFSTTQRAFGVVGRAGAVAAPFLGQIGMLAASAFVLLQALTESRTGDEVSRMKKADQRALRYLVESRRDPQGYLDLMGRLLNLSPEWKPYFYDFLYTRPMTVERYQDILKGFEKLPLDGRSFTANRDRYLAMTQGVREIRQ